LNDVSRAAKKFLPLPEKVSVLGVRLGDAIDLVGQRAPVLAKSPVLDQRLLDAPRLALVNPLKPLISSSPPAGYP
jgi:hypothetical protein